MKTYITWEHLYERINKLDKSLKYYGVPRGGSVIAAMTGNAVMTPEEADVIIDDLVDSGATMEKYKKQFPNKPFVGLFDKRVEMQGEWLVFPFEKEEDGEVQDNLVRIFQYLGEDPTREGLKETPKRYLKFMDEFLNPPPFNFTAFDSEGMDEMIIQTNIPFYSLCEHHLAPFFGVGHIAYIPNGKIVGLSKLARTLETYSRRLQNQERITQQVADRLMNELNPLGVAVVLKAQHLCMAMRGVKKHDVYTTTSKMVGIFKEDDMPRHEFMSMIK